MHKFTLFFIVLALLFTLPISAAIVKVAEEYSLSEGEIIAGDLYAVGGSVTVSGDVEGDTVVIGGDVFLNGITASDVFVLGGLVNVVGITGDDIRIVGGQITVGEDVPGDVVVLGGVIRILSNVSVGGDVITVGGRTIIDGDVAGDVQVYGGEVSLNGQIGGNTRLFISGDIFIGDNAQLDGDLIYTASHEADISETAIIVGEISFKETRITKDVQSFFSALFGAFFVTKILTLLVAGLLAIFVFRKFSESLVSCAISGIGKELLRGFVVLIAVPIALIFFFVTVLGAMVGILGLLVYVGLIIIAKIYTGIVFGTFLSKVIQKKVNIDWRWTVIGITLLQIISLVPIVGWLVVTVSFLVTLGAFSRFIYQRFWLTR